MTTDQIRILDHTQDLSGTETHRLTQLYPAPDFVKTASHDQLNGDPEKLAISTYADPAHRRFPCHTKAATWMSALFFGENRRQLTPIFVEAAEARLRKSASYWGILPVVETLWQKMAGDTQAGVLNLPDEHFALVWTADGEKHRNYPLRNRFEVKSASEWFGKFHDDFVFVDKHQIATKLIKRANELNAVLESQEIINRCAGHGYCPAELAAQAWEKRAQLCNQYSPDYAEQARQVAGSIRMTAFEARDQGLRIKMAGLMDQFDRQTKLTKLYDTGGLERPEEILFQITEKVASEFLTEHVQTTTGAIYEKTALEKLSLEQIQSWMGSEFAEAVSSGGVFVDMDKLAAVVPTLPRDEAMAFERMTQDQSIAPLAKEAASAVGMDDAERAALAAARKPRPVAIDL